MTEEKLQQVKGWVKEKIEKIKDPQHGWGHLERVVENARRIVAFLNLEKKLDINLLLATCYLHDISQAGFSPGFINYFLESRRLKAVLPDVLLELKINGKERNIIQKTIVASPYSFPFKRLNEDGNLYVRILQDADTLDFFSKEREASFKRATKKFTFYAFLGYFSKWALKYGRRNLKNYLNFPQLADELYVQKN